MHQLCNIANSLWLLHGMELSTFGATPVLRTRTCTESLRFIAISKLTLIFAQAGIGSASEETLKHCLQFSWGAS